MPKRYSARPPDTTSLEIQEKPIVWVGASLSDLLDLPDSIQQDIGYQLHRAQNKLSLRNSSPMSQIGPGVYEIRVDEDTDTYRAFYVAKFEEAIYFLHCFKKKSTKGIETPKKHLNLGKKRYKDMQKRRAEQGLK